MKILACSKLVFPTFMVLLTFSFACKGKMTPYQLHQSWHETNNQLGSVEITANFPYLPCFKQASDNHQIPVPLLLAVARGESDFDPTVISKANAIGVMQIQWPGTAKHLGIHRKDQLFDPCINIDAGARYLKELNNRYNDLNMALAAYNYGPGRIKTTMNWQTLPDGAKWYSEYIYDHLQFVTSKATKKYPIKLKHVLAQFLEPYRAKSMASYLKKQWPNITIDWFEGRLGKFTVVASFSDEHQLESNLPSLKKLGFHQSTRRERNQ